MKYTPNVVITIIEGALDTGRIPVDNAILLRCNVDANPHVLTYQWYINDEMVIGATLSELVSTFCHHSSDTQSHEGDHKTPHFCNACLRMCDK